MDAFLAHAVIDPNAATGADRPETRAAKALRLQILGPAAERPLARTWRARAEDGKQVALVVVADTATEADRERFALASERLCSSGSLPGTVRVHAVAPSRDAFVADLWTTGCATDLPALHWPPRRRLEFVRSVAQALDALHRAGMVHGSLCGDNVLLNDDLQPILAEAAMVSVHAVLIRQDCSSYAVFAAPEVKSGDEPDGRSDLWSAGRLLSQLVSEAEVPQAAEVVRRCMAFSPSMRYSSAQELVGALDAIIAALPIGDVLARPVALTPPGPSRERPAARIEQRRASTPGKAKMPALRWHAPGAAVSVVAPLAVALLAGHSGSIVHALLAGMLGFGTALATWIIPQLGRASAATRIALATSCVALVIVFDPISWAQRAGAQCRFHGDNATRRAAVVEIMELGRDFRGMSLAGLDLSGLDLTGADFRGDDLSHVDFSGSRLWSAYIEGASLEEAKLTQANLEETSLGEALHVQTAECDAATRLPQGWRCVLGRPSHH